MIKYRLITPSDFLFQMGSSLPRVRVDNPVGNGMSRGALRCWAAPSIAEEPSVVPEDDTTSLQDLSILGQSLEYI